MTEIACEQALAEVIKKNRDQVLASWNRQRTEEELTDLIARRLDAVEDVEL